MTPHYTNSKIVMDNMIELLADYLGVNVVDIESYYYSQQPPKFDSFVNEMCNEFMPEPQYTVVWRYVGGETKMPVDVKLSELLGYLYKENCNTRRNLPGQPD